MATPFLPPGALAALETAGIAERWAAVQEHLHPHLVTLAEKVQTAATHDFARQWLLYEVSFKSQRHINRGRGERAPIDEYHVAFDRPPRGSGILASVSSSERAVLVGLQLWIARKDALQRIWSSDRMIWQPLIERIERDGQARFTERQRTRSVVSAYSKPSTQNIWIDRYLSSRQANYLWAGFIYPWHNLPEHLLEQLVEDVLALLPLNEAIMEEAEEYPPAFLNLTPTTLREDTELYTIQQPEKSDRSQQPPPSIDTIIEHIHAQGFVGNKTIIRSYHVALQTRPLVILPGISGTGKTRLTRLYADAVHGIASPLHTNPYYLLVAVQPDWHNARDLLGYYNALSGVYHPTAFLRFLMRAAADPEHLYFVCLDEMNLARPEYYLAPLLSAFETAHPMLDLGIPADQVNTVSGETLHSPIHLPNNIRITGTVNVDETTHMLSDKLLDRANVIELTDVDVPGFRATYPGVIEEGIWHTLTQVHAIAVRAGQPFGYRTLRDMLRYLEQAQGVLSPQQALDLQIKQRILPRLRGEDSSNLRRALSDLLTLLLNTSHQDWNRARQITPQHIAAAPFPESAAKVRRMLERLDQDGFTDFYNA